VSSAGVEGADEERVVRRIGGADHHRFGLTETEPVHREASSVTPNVGQAPPERT
jgi:hypothetical protein